jgi:pSer/pThr/pTyr-binding forkhead associated (FHA) protein
MWLLRTTAGETPDGTPGETLRLMPGTARTLGRTRTADFIVDAPLLSRVHCRFEVSDDDRLMVIDLDSTNGTFVNDRRVERAVLAAGDRLRLGRLELLVEHAEST